MPLGLYRFHHSRSPHFITFSCYHRFPHLADAAVRDLFIGTLERTRALYRMYAYGFVVMPEHVHLLVSAPQRGTVANAMQSLKIASAKRGKRVHVVRDQSLPFWQKRYYDRNEWNHKEFLEKLKYIHRNPVKRGPMNASRSVKPPQLPTEGNCGPPAIEVSVPQSLSEETRTADLESG